MTAALNELRSLADADRGHATAAAAVALRRSRVLARPALPRWAVGQTNGPHPAAWLLSADDDRLPIEGDAQPGDGTDPLERHPTGARTSACVMGGGGSRLACPLQDTAWKTRPGIYAVAGRGLRGWLLLARASRSLHAGKVWEVLGREDRANTGAGSARERGSCGVGVAGSAAMGLRDRGRPGGLRVPSSRPAARGRVA